MMYLVIGAVLGMILSIGLFHCACKYGSSPCGFSSIFIGFMEVIMIIFISYFGFHWVAADYRTQIINREYDTKYTRAEVFYADDVIEIIRELDRNRYQINGNLIKK